MDEIIFEESEYREWLRGEYEEFIESRSEEEIFERLRDHGVTMGELLGGEIDIRDGDFLENFLELTREDYFMAVAEGMAYLEGAEYAYETARRP